MKNDKLIKVQEGKEVTTQCSNGVSLEPISFAELAEVLGGVSDAIEKKDDDEEDNGHTGGLVCWC